MMGTMVTVSMISSAICMHFHTGEPERRSSSDGRRLILNAIFQACESFSPGGEMEAKEVCLQGVHLRQAFAHSCGLCAPGVICSAPAERAAGALDEALVTACAYCESEWKMQRHFSLSVLGPGLDQTTSQDSSAPAHRLVYVLVDNGVDWGLPNWLHYCSW